MEDKEFLSTAELAKILGISRVAVFKKIKKGEIKATKIGRNFIINKNVLESFLGKEPTKSEIEEVDKAVEKTVKEYGETLKMLGRT